MRERSRMQKARCRRKVKIGRLMKINAELKSSILPVQQEEVDAMETKFINMLHQNGGEVCKQTKDEQQMEDLKVLEYVIKVMKVYAKSNDEIKSNGNMMDEGIRGKNTNKTKNGYYENTCGISLTEGINDGLVSLDAPKMMSTSKEWDEIRERGRIQQARCRRKAKIGRLTKSNAELKSALLPVQQEEVDAMETKFIEMLHQNRGKVCKQTEDEQQMEDLEVLEYAIKVMKVYAKNDDDQTVMWSKSVNKLKMMIIL
jgi:phage terminase small subunit